MKTMTKILINVVFNKVEYKFSSNLMALDLRSAL